MTRRGLTLTELMVALVIAGIIGAALTRLMISQSRFIAGQQAMMAARAGARAGFNVVVQELRMVTRGGVLQAHPDSLTVRVPFAYGVACLQPPGGTIGVALLPVDSGNYAAATLSGYAWRDSTGTWRFQEPAILTAGVASDCSTAIPPITVLTDGRLVRLGPNALAAKPGSPVYLYQNVRYALAPSAQVLGTTALWRTVVDAGQRDELVAPFDASSALSFLVGNALTVQASPPAVLDSVRGIRVRLVGQSETAPEGQAQPSQFVLSTDIVFVNRAP